MNCWNLQAAEYGHSTVCAIASTGAKAKRHTNARISTREITAKYVVTAGVMKAWVISNADGEAPLPRELERDCNSG